MKNRLLLMIVLMVWIAVFAAFGCSPSDIGRSEGTKVVRVREHVKVSPDRWTTAVWTIGFSNES